MLEGIHYLILALSAALSAVATLIVCLVSARLGLMDKPNPIIPQHTRPVAYLGGIGVAIGAGAVLAGIWAAVGWGLTNLPLHPRLTVMVLAGLAFVALGVVDDTVRLSARTKLFVQIILAVAAVSGGLAYPFTGVGLVDAALSTAWIVVLVNAVNVTDVCDGLVPGLGALTLGLWAHLDASTALVALPLAGAFLGFLFFNFPPARIFLGDTGSHLLGFALAAVMLMRDEPVSGGLHAMQMVLFSGPFVFELVLLVVVRRRKGLPWWRGSPDHTALRLQAAGMSRARTDLLVWSGAIGCMAAAFALQRFGPVGSGCVLLAIVLTTVWCWRFVLSHEIKSGRSAADTTERPLRILWIHQNLVTGRQAGNTRAVPILAGWLGRGWSVDVITTQTGYLEESAPDECPPVRIERDGELTIHRVRPSGGVHRRGLAACAFFARALWYLRRIGPVDVVYVSTPPPTQILAAVIASVWKSAPLVFEVRDLWPAFVVALKMVRSRLAVTLLEWLESLGCRHAVRCIAVSPAYVEYLQHIGVPGRRLAVVPSGADPAMDAHPSEDAVSCRETLGLGDRFVVLYTGSFNDPYAIEVLVEAAERLETRRPEIVWVFAGNGRRRALVESAAKRRPNVRYLGLWAKDELPGVFGAADLGIVSLADEPLLQLVIPGKLLDYMAAAMPVVSTIDGAPGAIIRAAGAGVVLSAPNAEELAAAVAGLADLPADQREAMGRGGQAWVHRYMGADRLAHCVAELMCQAYRDGQRTATAPTAMLAAMGACCDVITRRSPRAVRRLAKSDLSDTAARSVISWIEGLEGDRDGKPFCWSSVPQLLSGLDRTACSAVVEATINRSVSGRNRFPGTSFPGAKG